MRGGEVKGVGVFIRFELEPTPRILPSMQIHYSMSLLFLSKHGGKFNTSINYFRLSGDHYTALWVEYVHRLTCYSRLFS
jgi:hypothetical protein